MSASRPTSSAPLTAPSPNVSAGTLAVSSTARSSVSLPSAAASISSGSWYWMPGVPVWALHIFSQPTSFSSRVCGAWSEESMSIVPSLRPSQTAARSSSGTQ